MARINDKDRYPLQSEPKASDYVIGSDGENKVTKNFSIGALAAMLSTVQPIEYDLVDASTIQNDKWIEANGVYGMVQGQSFAFGEKNNTAGFIQGFDQITGTINISNSFKPFTGLVTIFYW